MKHTIRFFLVALSVAGSVIAADAPNCRKLKQIDDCTLVQVFGAFRASAVDMDEVRQARLATHLFPATKPTGAPESATEAAEPDSRTEEQKGERRTAVATSMLKHELSSQNVAVTPPASSPARIHASRQNFNIPLSAAINSVDRTKDEQSLVVRFNEARTGPASVGVTATITQPTLFKKIEKSIDAQHRTATADDLRDQLQDADNVSVSVHLAPATPTCDETSLRRGVCFGTEASAYGGLMGIYLAHLLPEAGPSRDTNEAVRRFQKMASELKKKGKKEFGQLEPTEKDALFDMIELAKLDDTADTRVETAARGKLHFDRIADLIANQPQWTFTASWQQLDQLVGPSAGSVEIEYSRGRTNLNSVVRNCEKPVAQCLAETVADKVSTDAFTFTVSFKQSESYKLPALPLPPPADGSQPPTFSAIEIPTVRQYGARAQYGFNLATTVNEKPIHFDAAATWSKASGNPEAKHTKYAVSSTLTIPLGDKVSFPVTIDYANRDEFLKDTQKKLGMHFGITYRVPFKAPK